MILVDVGPQKYESNIVMKRPTSFLKSLPKCYDFFKDNFANFVILEFIREFIDSFGSWNSCQMAVETAPKRLISLCCMFPSIFFDKVVFATLKSLFLVILTGRLDVFSFFHSSTSPLSLGSIFLWLFLFSFTSSFTFSFSWGGLHSAVTWSILTQLNQRNLCPSPKIVNFSSSIWIVWRTSYNVWISACISVFSLTLPGLCGRIFEGCNFLLQVYGHGRHQPGDIHLGGIFQILTLEVLLPTYIGRRIIASVFRVSVECNLTFS